MSWDADLYADVDGNRVEIQSWNYTHNCNAMLSTVLEENGHKLESHWLIGHMGKSWFRLLHEKDGKDGGDLLEMLVTGLEANPKRFRAMDPPNKWGSYDSVLRVLREMLEASRKYPSAKWDVGG